MDRAAEDAFREFVGARSMALIRTAYVLTGDQQLAEDLVQNALTKLAKRWTKVDQPEAYVRRILYHEQVSHWRRRRITEHSVESPPDRPDPRATEAVGESADRIDLWQALMRLAPRQRAVIVLRFYEDLGESQIAEVLGCTVSTVRSQHRRALARLRVVAPELSTFVGSATAIMNERTAP